MNAGTPIARFLSGTITGRVVWSALALLLVLNVPIFLSTRLNGDATFYDLQVQCLAEGGVLYRDMLEPNLPGVVWIHAAVRSIGGWSSTTLRAFDLTVLGAIITVLIIAPSTRLCLKTKQNSPRSGSIGPLSRLRERVREREKCFETKPSGDYVRAGRDSPGLTPARAACLALSVSWFYLALSTWSHCQRDTWMLLPALAAVVLRAQSIRRADQVANGSLIAIAILEGLLWGAAFWIKPHVAVPALCVLATSLAISPRLRPSLLSVGGVLCGGVAIGAVGSSWLIATGAWPHFWETQLEWNPEYLASRANWNEWDRYVGVYQSFSPWSWAHLVAVPFALFRLATLVLRRPNDGTQGDPWHPLLGALYLGWCVQSFALQHPFSYTHVPGVILAIAVVAGIRWRAEWQMVPRAATGTVFLIALMLSPCTDVDRFRLWRECVTHGPTLENRAMFQARPGRYWADYPELVRFLREHQVEGKDLFVYSSALVPLYRDLDLRPPNRYVLPDVQRVFFRSRAPLIRDAIGDSQPRFIVSDLSSVGLRPSDLETIDTGTGLPTAYPLALRERYPATQPVVFRSGWFFVHESRDLSGW